jgi:eukaryotic-like serine/threonine-protein kinase
MQLSPGARLGPYQIVAPIGAGGMGEVYRARDPRMARDVAIKVLPLMFLESQERRERFEQEARTTGSLSHPNLLVVHDVGTEEGIPFIVSEMLEGETLRQRLQGGPLPLKKGIAYAIQIATGLGAAHERGVVHRDLKPENIFITNDDRVKLLDFGLAKVLNDVAEGADASGATIPRKTSPGVVMGTPAYMAPEQVRGDAVDARADIFAFGVVVVEMLTSSHPFQRASSTETMGAVMNAEVSFPPGSLSPGLERILQHALEKQPSRRFQSIKDVIFALEMLSGSGDSPAAQTRSRPRAPKQVDKRSQEVALQRLTFRRGFILTARFAPDGSVIYGAAWEDESLQLYSSYPGNPESRPFGQANTDILAISRQGDLAVSLGRHFEVGWVTAGTLARMPLAGGTPREVCEHMQDADWSPDGKSFAIIRRIGNSFVIEYPIGHPILETEHWISHLRLSPKNDMIAYLDHPIYGDDAGRVSVIDLNGKKIVDSPTVWSSTSGVAWTPKGDEVWLAGERRMVGRDLIAVSLSGKERVVLPAPGRLTLHDISPQGEVLVSYDNARREIITGKRGGGEERNLTWFDWSFPTALSHDGENILFEEQGAGRRSEANSIYLRSVGGAPAVYLGDGRARAASTDGKWIVVHTGKGGHFEILPTGAGQPRVLHADWIETPVWWHWFPDGKRLLVWGNEPGKHTRMYEVDIESGSHRPVGPEETRWPSAISADGTEVVAIAPDGDVVIYATRGDQSRHLAGSQRGDHPIQWSQDNKYIWVYRRGRLRLTIDRIDVESGERTVWQELKPNDPAGVMDIMPVYITPDGENYAYSFRRYLSELYIVSGLL